MYEHPFILQEDARSDPSTPDSCQSGSTPTGFALETAVVEGVSGTIIQFLHTGVEMEFVNVRSPGVPAVSCVDFLRNATAATITSL
jgi:hypothetical protein